MAMNPDELIKKFVDWSITDPYNRWELFALNASINAFNYAIRMARVESDSRISEMKEFLDTFVEVNDMKIRGEFKDLPVYTPKDWR